MSLLSTWSLPNSRPSSAFDAPFSSPAALPYLLNLPSELRLLILSHALLVSSPTEYRSICDHVCLGKHQTYYLEIGSLRSTPSLARVNRKLRQEALSVFFQVNEFSITLYGNLSRARPHTTKWLNETIMPFIRHVDLRVDRSGRSAYTATIVTIDSVALATLDVLDENCEKSGVFAQVVVANTNASHACVRCGRQGQEWSLEKIYAVARVLLEGGCQEGCQCRRGDCEGHWHRQVEGRVSRFI